MWKGEKKGWDEWMDGSRNGSGRGIRDHRCSIMDNQRAEEMLMNRVD
jgi:hypothetical protein